MKSVTQSPWRYLYGISLAILILSAIAYGLSFVANMVLDNRIQTREAELQQVEDMIAKIGSEKAFFSYKFAEGLANTASTKRSDQITALITVLRKIQANNSIGTNAIQLSDFSVSPTKLTLKGKVSNLILLYYSSEANNYTNLIDRFAELPFITNISIKRYNKLGNFYEFSLDADINPNVIIEPQQLEPSESSNTTGEQTVTDESITTGGTTE